MKVILWDWDNTLADTIDPLMQAYNATLKDYNRSPITREQMKAYMNFAGRQLFLDLFPDKNFDEVRSIYLKHYQENAFKLKLFSGAKEILKWTKEHGFINILASNKHFLVLRHEAELSGVVDSFFDICGAEQFSENKPSKTFTDAALSKCKKVDQLFVIGDGVSDVKMARNYLGATAILVGTDPNAKEFENFSPDFSVKSLSELPKILSQQAS